MSKKFLEELKENGFKYIPMSKDEYPVWSLWDSPETIYIKGMLYKDLLEDSIYFDGIRYEGSWDKDEGIEIIDEYEDAILEVFINEDGNDVEHTLELAKELQDKINNGYNPKVRDVLGNFVGAETPYDFTKQGNKINTFKCDDIIEYLDEKIKE